MIYLNELLQLPDLSEWTICLNNENKEDVCSFLDENETQERKNTLLENISWCKTKGSAKRFRVINTKKCLQFLRIRGYTDRWLFLGSFDCCGTFVRKDGNELYILKRNSEFEQYSERLIVKYSKTSGDKQAKLSWKRYLSIEVIEILPDILPKTINPFPGYDRVCLSFPEMVRIFKTPFENWKEVLSAINGIYIITDESTGKLYVGSTYGHEGVWQRWMEYVSTNGHGGDKELIPLVESDSSYAFKYFRFTLIEHFFNIKKGNNDSIIIEREKYWKEALLTRKHGYNRN